MKAPIKVLVVDNHLNTRRSLVKVLHLNKDIEVVGAAKDGQEAISKVKECSPDVVLMDVKMPNLNGLEATRYIKEHYPKIKVLMLSAYNEQDLIKEALKAGATTYIIKNRHIDDLIEAIVHL